MSECEHDFLTVQSEDSRCMNCGETESSIQVWRYVQRIAELESETRAWKQAQDDWFQETKRRAGEYNELRDAAQALAINVKRGIPIDFTAMKYQQDLADALAKALEGDK